MPKSPKVLQLKPTHAVDQSHVVRWGGHESLLSDGYVPVARLFLKHASQLKPHGLTPAEAMFVLQLMYFKWTADAPYPGYKTIAAHMGISKRYARAIATSLVEKNLLRKTARVGTTNRFDLTPLFDALAAHVGRLASAKPKPGKRHKTRQRASSA